MPKGARIYAWAVIAAGAATAACAATVTDSLASPAMLTCLAVAALASTFKFHLPGLTGTIFPGVRHSAGHGG